MKNDTNGHAVWTLAEWQAPAPPDGRKAEADHRVAFLAKQEDFDCLTLGRLGMTVKTIAGYTGLSENQVNYRLKKGHVKPKDYRHGNGYYARMVFQYVGRRAAQQVISDLRKELNG